MSWETKRFCDKFFFDMRNRTKASTTWIGDCCWSLTRQTRFRGIFLSLAISVRQKHFFRGLLASSRSSSQLQSASLPTHYPDPNKNNGSLVKVFMRCSLLSWNLQGWRRERFSQIDETPHATSITWHVESSSRTSKVGVNLHHNWSDFIRRKLLKRCLNSIHFQDLMMKRRSSCELARNLITTLVSEETLKFRDRNLTPKSSQAKREKVSLWNIASLSIASFRIKIILIFRPACDTMSFFTVMCTSINWTFQLSHRSLIRHKNSCNRQCQRLEIPTITHLS